MAEPTPTTLLAALPMRDIRERAGTYGNCGGVAFAFVHLEHGTREGIEMVDALENLPDYAEDWRDLIDELLGHIATGIRDGFRDALGVVPPVRVLIYKIDPNPSYANPANHRRAGHRVAEEALRRACPPPASPDDLLAALPMRGVETDAALVDLERGSYPSVEVVNATGHDDEPVDALGDAARAAFRVRFGAEPSARLVVRRVGTDAATTDGREIVEELLRRLLTPLPAPPPPAASPPPGPRPPAASPRR